MNFESNGIEIDFEFCPLEHPIEPLQEDTPVKCPMPYSSQLNNNNRGSDQLMRKGEPPAQAARKRRHSLSREDTTLPPPPPLSTTPPLYRRSTSSLPSTMSIVRFNKCGS